MKISLICIFFFFFGISSLVNSQTDSCSSNLNLNNLVPFSTTSLNCSHVWDSKGFILRYAQSGPNLWNFILSAPDPNSYVGIGFSKNGKMVGSSAIVGWILRNGTGMVKQYYLGGTEEDQVQRDQGNLQVINGSYRLISQSSRFYITFQLITTRPHSRLLYSIGPENGSPSAIGILSKHRDKVSTEINYLTGESSIDDQHKSLRRSHGLLNMVGWGIFLPIGTFFARYFKHREPAWFYSHICVQVFGFILGLIGIITGFSLYDKLDSDVSTHRAIGIIILALGCLQLLAFLLRPDKASKRRKYWNWYHGGVGRALIIIAISNIFYGISLGDEGSSWNIGYGVALLCLLIVVIFLEVRMWRRK